MKKTKNGRIEDAKRRLGTQKFCEHVDCEALATHWVNPPGTSAEFLVCEPHRDEMRTEGLIYLDGELEEEDWEDDE